MINFFIQHRKLIKNKYSDSFIIEHGERLWIELAELLNVSDKAKKMLRNEIK